jgi:lysophospholipase L1-like esterase
MTRRRWLSLLAPILAAAGWFWWSSWSGPAGPSRPTAGERIIAFGDSLIQGVGASPGRDLVSVLERRLNVTIVNAGRSGDTTRGALSRLDQAVLNRQPRVVLVLLGGNDMLRRLPRDEMFDNLEAIVTRIRARGAAVVLASVEIGFFTNSYSGAYEALAARTSAALVPDILGGIWGRQTLMSDGIHPNDRGYEMMADRIEPVLRELLE